MTARRSFSRRSSFGTCICLAAGLAIGFAGANQALAEEAAKVFRAGAVAMDVSPLKFPVIINGNMTEVLATQVNDPLHARALVLDDGTEQAAIVIVDSCGLPRELLDMAKRLAHKATGIPTEHMLIAATHTHSAPSVNAALGSEVDLEYARFLTPKIAEAIAEAQKRLAPARIGMGIGRDEKNVGCRRWLMRLIPRRRISSAASTTIWRKSTPVSTTPRRCGPPAPPIRKCLCSPCSGSTANRWPR